MADSSVCTCGAMLPLPDLAGLVTCPGCGRVTRTSATPLGASDPAEATGAPTPDDGPDGGGSGWAPPPIAAPPPGGSWGRPQPVAGAPDAPPPTPKPAARSGSPSVGRRIGCGCIPSVILAMCAFLLFGAIRGCDLDELRDGVDQAFDSPSSEITLSGSVRLLPPEAVGGGATEVIAVTQDSTDGVLERRIARLAFTAEGSERVWESDPVDDDTSRVEIAVDGDTLFAATGTVLRALDADTGEERWRATLRDELPYGCPNCFFTVQGRLIVRTADAYVSAFTAESSEQAWSKRLRSTSGEAWKVGDQLLIVDEPEGGQGATPVTLTAPATGKAIRTTAPMCPADASTPWNLGLGTSDPIFPVAGTADVVAAFGFGDGCVVRWNPESGTTRWATRMDDISTFRAEDSVIGAKDLVVESTGQQLIAVELSSGRHRRLDAPTDTDAVPTMIIGRTLIADTTTTRGTTRGGLAAWDLATGERRWAQQTPDGAQPATQTTYHSSDALFDGSPRSVLVRTEAGANLFVFEGTERTFSVRTLDVASGDLGAPVRRRFLTRYDSGTPSLTVDGARSGRLIVTIDTLVQALPISGTGEISSYPAKD